MRFYIWAFIYKVTIEVVYVKIVSPLFAYSGLIWNPSMDYMLLSYFLFFLLLLLLPKGQDRPSHQLVQLFFFTTVVPLLSFFWQASQSLNYMLMVCCCCLILFSVLRITKPVVIPYTFNRYKKSMNIVHGIFFVTVAFLLLFTLKFGGIDMRTLSFENVYDVRSEVQYTGIWSYLKPWLGSLLIPFCIVMYMHNKKKLLFVLSCLMQGYLYMCTGQKTLFFSVAFLIGCLYMLKRNKWKAGIPRFYTLIMAFSTVIYLTTDYLMSIAIFPIRQLMIPAQISFAHYDFFSINPKLYFSEGITGTLFSLQSPYPILSTFLIGGGRGNWNTGYLANAYDNAGFFLMILFTVVFAFILLFVDSISAKSETRYIYTALLSYSIIILNDGALLTTLLTSGLGLLLIFVYVVASQERKRQVLLAS